MSTMVKKRHQVENKTKATPGLWNVIEKFTE
jgi:hypothetical protein